MTKITERRILGAGGTLSLGPQFANKMTSITVCKGKLLINPCEEGSLCGYARKANRNGTITLPRDAMRESGLAVNDHVDLLVDGLSAAASKAGEMGKSQDPLTKHVLELKPQASYKPAAEHMTIPLNAGKKLRLPDEAMKKAGIGRHSPVVVRINRNDGVWLEVFPAGEGDIGLESRHDASQRYGKHLMSFDGLRYLETLSGARVQIPSAFLRLFGSDWRMKSEVNIWVSEEKGCVVIEGPSCRCGLCSDTTRSLPEALKDTNICPECMPGWGRQIPAPPTPRPFSQAESPGKQPEISLGAQLMDLLMEVGEAQKEIMRKADSLGKTEQSQ